MAKKSRNEQVLVEKTPEPWPPITNGAATTAHSATAQVGGWRAGDGTRERTRHGEEIFLTMSKIHPTRGSNPRPRGATREPQPSGLRTFRISLLYMPSQKKKKYLNSYLPIIKIVACGFVPGVSLNVDASTTRRERTPMTRKSLSTTFPVMHPP
jgi:hypothetical protein